MKIKGEPYGIYVGTFVMNYHHGLLRLGVVREKRTGDHGWAYCKVDWLEDDIAIAAEAWDKKMGSTKEYSDETRADYLKPVSPKWLQNVLNSYNTGKVEKSDSDSVQQ
jgi:hypothetical protein